MKITKFGKSVGQSLGYTLIEVLIVLGILMIVFPMSMYLMSSLFDNQSGTKGVNSELVRIQSEFSGMRYLMLSNGTSSNGGFSIQCATSSIDISSLGVSSGLSTSQKIGHVDLQNFTCASSTQTGGGFNIDRVGSVVGKPYLMNPLKIPLNLKPNISAGFSTTTVNLSISKFGYVYLEK